jgi:hypothetical protein
VGPAPFSLTEVPLASIISIIVVLRRGPPVGYEISA